MLDLVKETGMMGWRLAETLMETNLKLQLTSAMKARDIEKFQRLVGTPGKGLLYKAQKHLEVEAYTDVD